MVSSLRGQLRPREGAGQLPALLLEWGQLPCSSTQIQVALVAESIEGALEIAKRYNPGKGCKVVFPIDPQSFFVGDDLERGGVVGKIAA